MTDVSVRALLRSEQPLVVIEAPAGCGKTRQAVDYAVDASTALRGRGRVLLLAHTHAACDVFSQRTPHSQGLIDVRTIDSLVLELAAAYCVALGLPADHASWARPSSPLYAGLPGRVARLVDAAPVVGRALRSRYPVVICDEHQDASATQHELTLALMRAGATVRVFGDPMQRIFGKAAQGDNIEAFDAAWKSLRGAGASGELDTPHRWKESPELGAWVLRARSVLRDGGAIDLNEVLPPGLTIIRADNTARYPQGYVLDRSERRPLDALVEMSREMLLLTPHNRTVQALRSAFNRRIPVWEGHVRNDLESLVDALEQGDGNPGCVAEAASLFLEKVCTGFTRSKFGNLLVAESRAGCVTARRGVPARIQALARALVAEPNHRGVSTLLVLLKREIVSTPAFKGVVHVDRHREYSDAVALGHFKTPAEGLAELARRRSALHPMPPPKSLSTIHKAKGLECADVVVLPCDAQRFPGTLRARRKLYVALSRATRSLALVVPTRNVSPLLRL